MNPKSTRIHLKNVLREADNHFCANCGEWEERGDVVANSARLKVQGVGSGD